MTVVIRPVQRSEVVEYLRVLPFANGLPSWEPAPAAWHSGTGAWPAPSAPAAVETLRGWVDDVMADGFRSQAAFVDGHLVGGSALLSLELTVPRARTVRMGGVTSTGVVATHRRRGLLRQMMQAMFTDAQDHGEFVVGLSASEGGIYGRFGFSPATQRTRWELDRADAAFIDAPPPRGSLELVDAATARGVWPRLHDTVRARRVGEVSAQPDQWEQLSDASTGTDEPLRYLLHRDDSGRPDGITHYRIPWGPGPDDVGTVAVEALEAVSTDAYVALWGLLVDLDLTRRVVAAPRPVDEPLRWLLRNPRALRVTRFTDNLWLRLLDVAAALRARAFPVVGGLVLEIRPDVMCPANTGTWRLTADPAGAVYARTNEAPDLTLDVQSLASLYLGGSHPPRSRRPGGSSNTVPAHSHRPHGCSRPTRSPTTRSASDLIEPTRGRDPGGRDGGVLNCSMSRSRWRQTDQAGRVWVSPRCAVWNRDRPSPAAATANPAATIHRTRR